jgi:hypothetical protein
LHDDFTLIHVTKAGDPAPPVSGQIGEADECLLAFADYDRIHAELA